MSKDHQTTNTPIMRIYHNLVYDTNSDRVLLLGGQAYHHWGMDLQDMWAYDIASNQWENLGVLEAGEVYSAAYDQENNRVIMVNLAGETWAYCYTTKRWEKMNPLEAPSGRCGHKMVYDSKSGKVILFGGFKCQGMEDPLLNDTWVYDYKADKWTCMKPEVSPPARIYHGMVYHPPADKTLVWGGRPFEEKEDASLWVYDYSSNSWSSTQPATGPTCRYAYPVMAYVPATGEIVMFGGIELSSDFKGRLVGETWVYSFEENTWEQLEMDDGPEPRAHHAMVYSTANDKILLFSGEIGAPYSGQLINDLWLFDCKHKAWSKILLEDSAKGQPAPPGK